MVPKTSYDEGSAEKKDILSHYKHDGGVGEPGCDEAKKFTAPFLTSLEKAESEDEDNLEDDNSGEDD